MLAETLAEFGLIGVYRDVLRDPDGHLRWDSGVRKNVIVGDCRRLLAGFRLERSRTMQSPSASRSFRHKQ